MPLTEKDLTYEEMKLMLQPITLKEAKVFVDRYHRHHKAPVGAKFAIGVSQAGEVVGVVMVGRPVARMLDDGWTAEVNRLCVKNGHKNAASMLYGAAWRAARAMGYLRLITYILSSETGTSLIAAGYKDVGKAGGGTWNREGRPRVDTHPVEQKTLFERVK